MIPSETPSRIGVGLNYHLINPILTFPRFIVFGTGMETVYMCCSSFYVAVRIKLMLHHYSISFYCAKLSLSAADWRSDWMNSE